ncbi:RNA polymerase sigma factor [Chitinophaga ginsengisoli]|uniref:RNA polymerase sigma factor (Sigma-70 family) n=1 Tax=Chitinophaga ginsengisoli TaxID=363837 RepID=A0A2P8G2A8_9BACT|nr:sigma-70 family RNA polymerase sigma factor [Chitinophaga ginsengisoli]PSL28087.1 RNA polymerase sigma factor (sigma-70 family) [Chitinophaga ginsengisoli]
MGVYAKNYITKSFFFVNFSSYMSCDSDFIVKALIEGHNSAYELFFERYYNRLYYRALELVLLDHVAEDMVQDTFMEVWEKKLYIQPEDNNLDRILFVVLKHNCIDYLRRHKSQKKFQDNLSKDSLAYQTEDSFKHQMDEAFYSRRLSMAISKLTDQQRQALDSVYMQEKTYREGASTMRIALSSFKKHLERAIFKLRREYSQL